MTQNRQIIGLVEYGLPEDSSLGTYVHLEADHALGLHSHPNAVEICYLHRGEQIYEVNGEEFRMKGGDVFVTFPDEPHSTAGLPQEKSELFWLIVPLHGDFLGLPETDAAEIKQRLCRLPQRLFPGNSDMRVHLHQALEAHLNQDPLRRVLVRCNLTVFLLDVIVCAETEKGSDEDERVRLVQEYVRRHLADPIGVPELADAAGLSESRFKSWFRDEVGIPPAEFLNRERIKVAKHCLRNSDDSITDIAFETGFASSQYFATVFRRFTGMSPGDFRRG